MVTKEQCLLEKILDEVDYGRNQRMIDQLVKYYNAGKQYISEMVFMNNEDWLDYALRNETPSFIVFSLTNEENQYNRNDPLFTVGDSIHSFDGYEFRRMLDEDGMKRILSWDVVQFMDSGDANDAFMEFVQQNYPAQYQALMDAYDYRGFDVEELFNADWNQLANSVSQRQMNEGRTLELTEDELRQIVHEGTIKVYNELKESGIHIDPKNKGKFTATKERTGKSTEELTHSKNPLTRKRANFARMAKRGWKSLKNDD